MNLFIYLLPFLLLNFSTIIDDDCTCNGIKLYGRVEIVDSFGDLKVEVVEDYADLNVEIVSGYANDCGEWEIVKSGADFKVEFVEDSGDIKVKFINSGYPDGYPGKK